MCSLGVNREQKFFLRKRKSEIFVREEKNAYFIFILLFCFFRAYRKKEAKERKREGKKIRKRKVEIFLLARVKR